MCSTFAGLHQPLPVDQRAAPSALAERDPVAVEPLPHAQAQKVSSLCVSASRKGCSWLWVTQSTLVVILGRPSRG